MGHFILMPKLGMTMTEGQIIKWLVTEGQQIEKGDFLFEVETDKTTLEVDSLYEGVIRKLYYDAPVVVPINTPVAYIGAQDEAVPAPPPVAAETPELVSDTAADAKVTKEDIAETPQPQNKPTYDYDLVVIGAGPGGYVSAIRAAQLGAKVLVVEKDACGGTCLNRGCIPTKALYYKAKEWMAISRAEQSCFSVSGATFDWKKIMAFKDATVKQLVGGVNFLLTKNKIKLIKGQAAVKKTHEVTVGNETISAGSIILATGSRPLMRVAAENKLYSTDELLSLDQLPEKLVIIGGGVVGCEMAYIYNAFGVDVTLIEIMPQLLPAFDKELSAVLANRMLADDIKVMTQTQVDKVSGVVGAYTVHLSDGRTMQSDAVLEAIGRQADKSAFSEIGLKLTEKGYVAVDDRYATSVEGLYAIGDCTGISQLAHSASHQGIQVAERLFGETSNSEAQLIPACIFSALEIATVGKTLDEAAQAGFDAMEFKVPYTSNGKALAMNAREGFIKVVADKRYGEILGVHIIGEQASVLIHEAVMVMRGEMTASEAAHTIHVHPTLNEMLMEAYLGCSTGAIHV